MTQELKCNTCSHKNVCNQAAECACEEYAPITSIEELIKQLELDKPTFDGEDTNYDVATIENAITIIEKYAEIKKIVDKWYSSDIVDGKNEISHYFQQILDVFSEVK